MRVVERDRLARFAEGFAEQELLIVGEQGAGRDFGRRPALAVHDHPARRAHHGARGEPKHIPAALADLGDICRRIHLREQDQCGWVLGVEFGDTPRAYSVLAYGQSRLPASPWYSDQAAMFAKGEFKKVAFTEADVNAQTVVRYRPGQKRDR